MTVLVADLETSCCASSASPVSIGKPNGGTWSTTIVRCDRCSREFKITITMRAHGRTNIRPISHPQRQEATA